MKSIRKTSCPTPGEVHPAPRAGPAPALPDIQPDLHPGYYTTVFISQHQRSLEPELKHLPDYPSAQSFPRDKVK